MDLQVLTEPLLHTVRPGAPWMSEIGGKLCRDERGHRLCERVNSRKTAGEALESHAHGRRESGAAK